MELSLYDLALNATLRACDLKGRDAVLGSASAMQNIHARCIFVRLLSVRGCSDTEISEYARRSRQVISWARHRAQDLYKKNSIFSYNYDYANHLMHESIQLTEG